MTSMRKLTTTLLLALTAAPALAWVPKLDETTAKAVIDGAYDRRDPLPTFLTLDLSVKDGKFATPDAVRAVDGGDACLSTWLSNPADYATNGSRPAAFTFSGQADQLFFQAQDARNNFKNLSVKDALAPADNRLQDGLIRVEASLQGLPTERARNAYQLRLKGKDGKLIAPVRANYVSDWKQTGDTWGGTMVYYFDATKAGLAPNSKAEFLLRTEADSNCAYSLTADLGKFY